MRPFGSSIKCLNEPEANLCCFSRFYFFFLVPNQWCKFCLLSGWWYKKQEVRLRMALMKVIQAMFGIGLQSQF